MLPILFLFVSEEHFDVVFFSPVIAFLFLIYLA